MNDFLEEFKKINKNGFLNVRVKKENIEEIIDRIQIKDYDEISDEISDEIGMNMPENDHHFLNYTNMILDWDNPKNDGFYEYLFGGFKIYGVDSAIVYPTKFYEPYYSPELSIKDKELVSKLSYFQKSGHGDDGVFGCILMEKGVYPPKLYLFDHNVIFPLDMTFQKYFSNMLKCNAVTLWQYFFIKPEIIVEKLKDISIEKWHGLYADKLGDVSRADGVLAHMEKVVRMFPKLFPDTDITFFQEKHDALKKALEELS